jgi:hypothetical protein
MSNIYFYIAGLATSFFAFLAWYYAMSIKTHKLTIDTLTKEKYNLIKENADLRLFKEKRKSKQRRGVLTWSGWHKTKDPSNKWTITLNLKEVAKSESDPNLYQFEVESVFSPEPKDQWNYDEYNNYFLRQHSNGWLNITRLASNQHFHWVINETKEDLRDDKLEQLGIV